MQDSWPKIVAEYREVMPSCRLSLTITHIPPEEQRQLFNQGRNGLGEVINEDKIVTMIDGERRQTLHNRYPSEEIDVTIYDHHGLETKIPTFYIPLEEVCKKLGLTFVPPNHIRVPLNRR